MLIDQIAIPVLGVTAVWITQQGNEDWKKWACILGIASQPFWFYTSYVNDQWGIFIASIFYTYSWVHGFYVHWWDKVKGVFDESKHTKEA